MTTPPRRSRRLLSPRGIALVAPARLQGLLACPDCDLLTHRVAVPRGARAFCPRCGALLFRDRVRPVERTLATALAALVLYVAAVTLPFLQLEMAGRAQLATLVECVEQLGEQGAPSVAVLVALTGLVAPAVLGAALVYLALALGFRRAWPGRKLVARVVTHVQPWAMAEVFLLGVLVSLLKLTKEAEITFGTGSFAFAAMVFALTAAQSAWDPETAWRLLDEAPVPRRLRLTRLATPPAPGGQPFEEGA